MSPQSKPLIRVAIDRGGTFTDIYAQILYPHPDDVNAPPRVQEHVLKLLSDDPASYPDAPTEGIRRILSLALSTEVPPNAPLPTTNILSIRMGTTIATNALLERTGHPCAFATTHGLRDLLYIGNQSRPNLFDLTVAKQPPLYDVALEVNERLILDNETSPPTVVVRQPLNEQKLRNDLSAIHATGITSLAVALMHSYLHPAHERRIREIALSVGFTHVSLSSELTPMIKLVPRAFTATVDAYLTPKIRDYLSTFRNAFADRLRNTDVQFMQSDGGLCDIDAFYGYIAILSGPAGGVVGYARTAYGFELNAPEKSESYQSISCKPLPVIGFDMGGTSTDVSRYAGRFEHVFETTTAGVTIQAPQLDINTVAAGGGSRLFFRAGMFYVGPESAGAQPGPVCYRKNGHLTVTDANVLLGRIEPALFPHIFGPDANLPLDVAATRAAFAELTAQINAEVAGTGDTMTAEDVADGFIRVANETMCRPIRELTEAKGYDVRDHALACFGGAGGQHACAIAHTLGIGCVFVHRFSGVLSAFGIAMADSVVEAQEPVDVSYGDDSGRLKALGALRVLRGRCVESLRQRGFEGESIRCELYVNLRYEGTDFGIMVLCPPERQEDTEGVDFAKLFVKEYAREHGFCIADRNVIIDDVRVRALGEGVRVKGVDGGKVTLAAIERDGDGNVVRRVGEAEATMRSRSYFKEDGGWLEVDIWKSKDLPIGKAVLPGPCMIVDSDAGNTVMVDPGCVARIASDGNILISIGVSTTSQGDATRREKATDDGEDAQAVDAVKLSIYSHRFMGIAEQMGRTLQRTSISTNIKERLDFSCALFDETGGLVANAPHVPVHLGAMQDAVRFQKRALGEGWREGEVILSNHPQAGGTHLPDITLITPVFVGGRVVFYVASRGHHADIGGVVPGSMPPFSKLLCEEGMAVQTLKIVQDGQFEEDAITALLRESGCRCIRDVVSDLRAQVAANQKGIALVKELIEMQGLTTVLDYMHHIQRAAANAVRGMLRALVKGRGTAKGEVVSFRDVMDDGTVIALRVDIDGERGCATFDFEECGDEVAGNTNAPRAVASSAIIYALRCLVNVNIPLNQGCLEPITIKLRKGSILNPGEELAVVGGNVLTSQRVTDVILGAFGACAASQGCMNNLTFGDETMGYYETIGGGAGAGPGWHGSSGVHTHMTNTRITDGEILERRYPVILREFALRRGSGGKGEWKGGEGVIRALEFRREVTVSLLTERRVLAPWGLRGGGDGERGRNEIVRGRDDGVVEDIGGRMSVRVRSGDMVRVKTPGGGGYGAEDSMQTKAKAKAEAEVSA